MNKLFITANELLLDSFRLARQVIESGFRPDIIVGVWRGGAPVGIAVQEYFAYLDHDCDHIAIRTSSYYGIDEQREVRVLGMQYLVENFSPDQSILLVDDVFDSGRSVEAILASLTEQLGVDISARVKIACPWYKPSRNKTKILPDYYLHQTDAWLVFPHEIVGLTAEEIADGKPELSQLLAHQYLED